VERHDRGIEIEIGPEDPAVNPFLENLSDPFEELSQAVEARRVGFSQEGSFFVNDQDEVAVSGREDRVTSRECQQFVSWVIHETKDLLDVSEGLLGQLAQDGIEDVSFGLEMSEDRGLGHGGCTGDVSGRDIAELMARKEPECALDDGLASCG